MHCLSPLFSHFQIVHGCKGLASLQRKSTRKCLGLVDRRDLQSVLWTMLRAEGPRVHRTPVGKQLPTAPTSQLSPVMLGATSFLGYVSVAQLVISAFVSYSQRPTVQACEQPPKITRSFKLFFRPFPAVLTAIKVNLFWGTYSCGWVHLTINLKDSFSVEAEKPALNK